MTEAHWKSVSTLKKRNTKRTLASFASLKDSDLMIWSRPSYRSTIQRQAGVIRHGIVIKEVILRLIIYLISLSKGDEVDCNILAKAAFYPPIYSAVVTLVIGCTLLLVKMIADNSKEKKREREKKSAVSPEGSEVDKMIRCAAEAREVEGNYNVLHATPGGVRMLIGTSFAVLQTPQEKHAMAKYIFDKEVEIHKSRIRALRCLRSKGWSQRETSDLLENVAKPNFLKKVKYQVLPQGGRRNIFHQKPNVSVILQHISILLPTSYSKILKVFVGFGLHFDINSAFMIR